MNNQKSSQGLETASRIHGNQKIFSHRQSCSFPSEHCSDRNGFYTCWWVMSEKGTRSEHILVRYLVTLASTFIARHAWMWPGISPASSELWTPVLLWGTSTQRGSLIPFSLLSQYNLSHLTAILLETPYRHSTSSTWARVTWMVRMRHSYSPYTHLWRTRSLRQQDPWSRKRSNCCSDGEVPQETGEISERL